MKVAYVSLPWLLVMAVSCSGVQADSVVQVSICDCQQYQGVSEGDFVEVTGICTVETAKFGGYQVIITDQAGGPWCSIMLYDPSGSMTAERGQCVTAAGILREYYEKTEILIDSVYPFTVWDCGWGMPEPIEVQDCVIPESYESCMVRLECLTVMGPPDIYGRILLFDRYGCEWSLLMRMAESPPPAGTEVCSIVGWIDFILGNFSFRPRDSGDWDFTDHEHCIFCPPVTPSPLPTETPSSCDVAVIELILSGNNTDCYQPGDACSLKASITNPCQEREVYLFAALEIFQEFFFWPSWRQYPDAEIQILRAFESMELDILELTWPTGFQAELSGRFWSVAMDSEEYDLISNVACEEFCYGY